MGIKEEEIQNLTEETSYSKGIMASYGARELFGQSITGAFAFSVFFFYEVVIGLNVGIAALAFIIFSIWNAINDPLIGYIMEKVHMPWEKKWGIRRFPWMLIGAIPWLFSYMMIFMVPASWDPVADQWLIFTWFLVSICLYDTLLTIYDVNVVSLYPDKFVDPDDRRTAQGFGTLLGIIGIVLSAVIPPMFITTGIAATYQTAAIVSVGLGLVLFLFILPGIYEDKKLRRRYEQIRPKTLENKPESFLKSAKIALSNRTFVIKIVFFFGYQAAGALIQASAFYIVTYILDDVAFTITILLGAMLLGALISVPLWVYISKKLNDNKKVSLYAGIIMFFTFIPMFFVYDLIGWVISLVVWGIGLGGQWFMDPPTMGDVLDDAAVKTGKREQSIYYGYQAFFIRFGLTFQAVLFAIVHSLTGFVEGATSLSQLAAQSPSLELALFGIRLHAAIIPAILVLITVLVFWKWYDLTPAKVAENKKKLEELGLQ